MNDTNRSESKAQKPRVAASSYLNTAPLIWSFVHGSMKGDVDLVEAVPARCAELLAQSEVDFALVPVIEYQRIAAARLVPDVCVGSRERVRSVVMASKHNNLKKISSVALDESSRTSATLVKILFKEFLGFEPAWTTSSPDIKRMLRQSDAALIIGDPAMTFSRAGLQVWDMASLWRDFTGLGFIFAMWMALETNRSSVSTNFKAARDEGLEATEEIIDSYENALPLSREELREYLTSNITFKIDKEMESGLRLYYDLAYKHGVIEEPKDLKFLTN
jgi:chorismate dehydratase